MRPFAVLAVLAASLPAAASDLPTCQEIIDAKDAPAMQAKVSEYRSSVLKATAIMKSQRLFKDLEEAGIKNAYQVSVQQYETVFMITRDASEVMWADMEKQHGGMSAAFAALCPERDTSVMDYYRDLYDVMLVKAREWRKTQD